MRLDQLPDLLSTDQLAAYLGVPVKTVRAWRYTGAGPEGFRVGRHVRYRRDQVLDWLEQQAAAAR